MKSKLNLSAILEKAIFAHRIVFETKWFKQHKEITSSEVDDITTKWKKIAADNDLVLISGFFQIPDVGYVPLTIYKSGLIIAPEDLSRKDIKTIESFLKGK